MTKKVTTSRKLIAEILGSGWSCKAAGAVIGLFLGIMSPLVGSVFTVISWFTGPHWHGFSVQRYGTVLLFLTIPFLLLGAHCLDLMNKPKGGEDLPGELQSLTLERIVSLFK